MPLAPGAVIRCLSVEQLRLVTKGQRVQSLEGGIDSFTDTTGFADILGICSFNEEFVETISSKICPIYSSKYEDWLEVYEFKDHCQYLKVRISNGWDWGFRYVCV